MNLIVITGNDCSEALNCLCCKHNDDGTYECPGCGSVLKNNKK